MAHWDWALAEEDYGHSKLISFIKLHVQCLVHTRKRLAQHLVMALGQEDHLRSMFVWS